MWVTRSTINDDQRVHAGWTRLALGGNAHGASGRQCEPLGAVAGLADVAGRGLLEGLSCKLARGDPAPCPGAHPGVPIFLKDLLKPIRRPVGSGVQAGMSGWTPWGAGPSRSRSTSMS